MNLIEELDRMFETRELRDGACVCAFVPSDSFSGFRGHFPGDPILPGVIQILMARRLAELASGRRLVLKRCVRIKFVRPLRPCTPAELRIRTDDSFRTLDAEIAAQGMRISTAKLELEEAEA